MKKNLIKILSVVMFLVLIISTTYSQAAEITETGDNIKTLQLNTLRPASGGEGFSFDEQGALTIHNVVEYNKDGTLSEVDTYCIKAGVGFASGKQENYNVHYNFRTDREIMKNSTNVYLKEIANSEYYKQILWIFDKMYIKGKSTEDEKLDLMKKATSNNNLTANDIIITDDEIEAVQQAAMWFFTNNGDNKYAAQEYYDNGGWHFVTTDGVTFTSYSSTERGQQAQKLYKYLIDSANANIDKYDENYNIAAPISIQTETLQVVEDGDNYILGPIDITKNNDLYYSIDMVLKDANGNEISKDNYKLMKKSEATGVYAEVSDKDIKNKFIEATNNAGNKIGPLPIYISIPKTLAEDVKVALNINYNKSNLEAWIPGTNTIGQPLVYITRTPDSIGKTFEPKQKYLDLALRKYVTKINDIELTETRVPNVVETSLEEGTTATYQHRKNAVVVETGNKITYKLTIYNEGNIAGRATKLIDQLPTGLKFSKVVSGNFELDTYDENTNKVTLKRISTNTENLPAYEKGNLVNNGKGSETVEIECIVEATADTQNKKVLTNVAWISEAYDENGNIVEKDRDSSTSTTPNVNKDNMSDYTGNGNKTDLTDSGYYYKGQEDDDDFEKLVVLPKTFDLKLIKRVTEVNGTKVPERIQSVDVSNLNKKDEDGNITVTTGNYDLIKDPVGVKKGDLVKYTFRIYNEGERDGYAAEITEDIPEGLEFIWSEKEGEELENDTTFTQQEKEAIEFNQEMGWTMVYNSDTKKLEKITTDYLAKGKGAEILTEGANLIKAFDSSKGYLDTETEKNPDYKEVSVILKVISDDVTGTQIRNEACISKDTDKDGNEIPDRDSDTDEWVKYEDDEDYDIIKLQYFDISLRKFIIAVSNSTEIKDEDYLKNTNGSYSRAPIVDTSKLNTIGEDGKIITTAIYNHSKTPVEVKKNDIVVYMLRVYNEGNVDGYVGEITDHLPKGLEFVECEYNNKYGWTASEDGKTVKTTYLKDSIISKASTNGEGKIVLSYEEVPILCKINGEVETGKNITNIAEVTEYLDENKKPVLDRDSSEDNVEIPTEEKLPSYKDDETGDYIPGQEDDDDFEKVVMKKFDLALRKFITSVNDEEVTTRIPQISYEDGKITYTHSKEPLEVTTNNTVTYTLRVYNEGEVDGYAKLVSDDIPEGLEYLPDNKLNKTMRWTMYKLADEKDTSKDFITIDGKKYIKTDDAKEADIIATDYLSKEQEDEEYDNLIKAFDPNSEISQENPDYKDVQVTFKVVEPNTSDKVVINYAQIVDDSDKDGNEVEDKDSEPGEWNDGEDDQDKEYIKLQYFDLSLRKWVTEAIVTENGKTTVTKTGHTPEQDPEPVVKVELHRKKISKVTVKFKYSIRVTNEGDIAGYAKEIKDYIPQGLKFVASENPNWKDEGNNVISTRALENTLLQPGEYADVEVILTWINGDDNMGEKVNEAEISEDYNDQNVPDKDSTPDNKKDGEDDIDDAPVLITVSTGQVRIYFTLGFIVLITIAAGIVLIKKFVL